MKAIFTLLTTVMKIFSSYAQPFSGLVLEEIDNGGAVSGTTYRLYAQINEGSILTAMFGDETRPHLIETTTSFFNAAVFGMGADFQQQVNTGAFGFGFNNMWDTWITIGDSYSQDELPQSIGDLNINSFSSTSWSFGGTVDSDSSIFRLPDDPLCLPNENGLVY